MSRFPVTTETFIARELAIVSGYEDIELELLALFRSRDAVRQVGASPWVEYTRRPGALRALRGLLAWSIERPFRTASSIALIVAGHLSRPALLLRALATIPIAAAHARDVREFGIDHVHAHFASYPALAAWLCWRLTGVPYSVTAHAHDLFMSQVFLRRKLADARAFVTVSEYNRRFLASVADGSQTPVHVIRAGLDPDAYRFRAREPAPQGPLAALCVGGLKEYKGQHVLLRALALGGPHVSRMRLRLVGDGPLRAALEKAARELGISDRVCFLGALPESAVIEQLDDADVFVMPSVVARSGQKDGIPVALMEALAAGVPAVASRVSGVPELIVDGETGILAEPGDPQSLRDALERALADPAAIRARADAARTKIEAEFDISSSAEALRRLFRESAGQAAPT